MRLPVLLCAVLAVVIAGAQDATIRTNVPLVVLQTSVTDQKGHPVSGLTDADFQVLDNGVARPVHVETIDDGLGPVSLVIAIQSSNISAAALAKVRKVGAAISQGVVGENGEAAVITYGDAVQVVQDFTRNPDEISNVFEGLKPGDSAGGRAIDAVAKAEDMLASRPGRRWNILMIGESRDRGSEIKFSSLLDKLQHSAVTIYFLSYSAYLTPFTAKQDEMPTPDSVDLLGLVTEPARLAKVDLAKVLTQDTGGRRLGFETKTKLENDLIRVGNEMHNRYILTFTPPQETKPGFHHLQVTVKAREDLFVRVRPGYFNMPGATP